MAYAGQILENPVTGERIIFRKTAADTDGKYVEIDLVLAPDGAVPGTHVHPLQVETFEVIKGREIAWPRIESEEHIMTVGSARPMEDAARIAYSELVGWLSADYGFDVFDAYQLLTHVGGLYVGNMVDTTYSLVARCPKRYLS